MSVISVAPDFAVAPQVRLEELPQIAAAGYRLLINNRPDGEAADQPSSEQMREAAAAAGLDYVFVPVRAPFTTADVEAMAAALQANTGPALAYCRSGTRSITLWALAQALGGAAPDSLIRQARAAGYDLTDMSGALDRIAAR